MDELEEIIIEWPDAIGTTINLQPLATETINELDEEVQELLDATKKMEIDCELSLGNLEFPSDFSILTHPNVFIGNTGAFVT